MCIGGEGLLVFIFIFSIFEVEYINMRSWYDSY